MKGKVINILDEIISLLLKDNFDSEYLRDLRRLFVEEKIEDFSNEYKSLSFWGGAGALWEIWIEDFNIQLKYWNLIIELDLELSKMSSSNDWAKDRINSIKTLIHVMKKENASSH